MVSLVNDRISDLTGDIIECFRSVRGIKLCGRAQPEREGFNSSELGREGGALENVPERVQGWGSTNAIRSVSRFNSS